MMKADATAENKPACYPPPKNQINITTNINAKNIKDTHKDQCGIQVFVVFLDKIVVVLVGFTLELVVELYAGATGNSEEVRKESWQRLEHCLL